MFRSQPDHHPDIQDFHHWIDSVRTQGVSIPTPHRNGSFIPKSKLRAYFQDTYHARKLLAALYPDVDLPVDPQKIGRKHFKVFSILLLIGKGHYIQLFIQHGELQDKHLPFGPRPKSFPFDTADPEFFTRFCKRQWEFCPPTFEDNMEMHFEDQDVLPIVEKWKIGNGGSEETYRIVLHEAYNNLDVKDSSLLSSCEPDMNTFVLKTFEGPDAEKDYASEVNGFKKLRHAGKSPNIIRFHGSFTHGGTRNILLEYANGGTLEQYYQRTKPPSSGEHILTFWERLLGLLGAVMAIHGVEWNDSEGPQFFQGWHQDLKPSNILIKLRPGSPYDCEFKLADLGLSHFRRKSSSQREATHKDAYGTRAYGAPECYRFNATTEHSPLQVKKNVDVWSLGCIFSEAAVWVVHGWGGLQEYRRRRRMETDEIPGFRDGHCFHDGEKVLRTVHTMHRNLAEDRRASDHISAGQDLYEMIRLMLEQPKARPEAKELYYKAERITNQARIKLGSSEASPLSLHASRSGQASLHMRQPPPKGPPRSLPLPLATSWPHGTSSPTVSPGNITDDSECSYSPSNSPPIPITPSLLPDLFHPRISQGDSDHIETERLNFGQRHDDVDVFGDGSPSRIHSTKYCACKQCQQAMPRQSQRRRQNRGSTPTDAHPHHMARWSDEEIPNDKVKVIRATTTGASSQIRCAEPGSITEYTLRTPAPYSMELGPRETRDLSTIVTLPRKIQELPTLGVDTVQTWRNYRKMVGKNTGETLPYQHHMQDLKKRDHVFLIDDSISMQGFWKEVLYLFEPLTYLLKESDPDGIELYFTMSDDSYRSRRSSKLVEALKNNTPPQGKSNIRTPLKRILKNYQTKLREDRQAPWNRWLSIAQGPVRPQNLYIFTDGVWQPRCDIKDIVEDFVRFLKEQGLPREQFGIQFISFGNNVKGLDRLARLDSGLDLEMDIIDTEPFNGNVWKMLLGPIHPWFDGDYEDGDD